MISPCSLAHESLPSALLQMVSLALLLHASMIRVLSDRLFDIAAYLLPLLLVDPYLDSFPQGLISVEYQFADTSFEFAYQFLYVISVDEQWYMLAQRHGDGICCIGSVLFQYLWDGFLVPSFQQTQLSHEVIIVSWLKAYFLHQIFGVFLLIVHAQPFGNIVDPRPLQPSPIPLPLHHPLALLIIFNAHQLLIAHHRLNLPELWRIHHLCLKMLLDEFHQVTSPYLFVLFGTKDGHCSP